MSEQPKDSPSKNNRGAEWIAIGVAIGVGIGAAMDNMSAGIPIGIAIGLNFLSGARVFFLFQRKHTNKLPLTT